jgi:hypothetical protein
MIYRQAHELQSIDSARHLRQNGLLSYSELLVGSRRDRNAQLARGFRQLHCKRERPRITGRITVDNDNLLRLPCLWSGAKRLIRARQWGKYRSYGFCKFLQHMLRERTALDAQRRDRVQCAAVSVGHPS